MSQYPTKYNIISTILITFVMAITLTGCYDDFIETVEIPDAEVTIKGEVFFKPLVSTEVQTRSEAPGGAEYTGIKSLYVMFFDGKTNADDENQLLKKYSGYVDFINAPAESDSHERVTFKKKVPAGRYYVYAIANIADEQKNDFEQIASITDLRNFKLNWNNDIEKDLEMFGVFKHNYTEGIPDNESFEADALLTITPHTNSIHSWMRRAVSKITIDFDGTALKDGVTVYIKNATLKDVPSGALLGTTSAVGADGITCTQSDYSITYGRGADHNAWPTVTNEHSFTPSDVWGDGNITSFHDDNAKALPCYENMQGEPEGKSKLQDSNGDGIIDSYIKDGVDNGTYLEVEGYYVANRPEYKSQGKIIYRFMLGENALNNFDLVRNHHYKITLRFKDYGNDIDWHIVYSESHLDATYPEDVNYQGKFFVPDSDYYDSMPNAGHTFSDQNVITVKSYETDGKNKRWKDPEISYSYYSYDEKTGTWNTDNTTAGWLTATPGEINDDGTQKKYTFVASMTEPESVTINSLFPMTAKGSKGSPYNLSNENGGSTVENTANCYMVGAPGWYCFPLVYGNAITGGDTNAAAYASEHMVNHLNKHITEPYIKDNTDIDLSDVDIKLIWQDAENLITPDDISYDPALFGGKGGIKFHIGTIQEGNAVIALIDNNAEEDEYVDSIDRGEVYGVSGSTKAIWSWHIWATRFGFRDFETDIRILNHDEEEFNVMPVNLGWCSGDKAIRYYKRRKCEIKFKTGEHELVRTIEQYPHLVLPRGDHPYYQWGRKDPFVGTNLAWGNKPRWNHDGDEYTDEGKYNPPRLYQEPAEYQYNAKRKHSKDCLDVLVKNPDKWHNAPRNPKDPTDFKAGFYSTNISFTDLWSNNGEKTVYDPCPSGYQIGDETVFTGFTTSGINAIYSEHWYDVLESNMQLDYYNDGMVNSSVNSRILEFYTDTRKLQSITFPVTGYRDYDAKAEVTTYPTGSYNGMGYVWYNVAQDATNSYHLKFMRADLNGGDWHDRMGTDQIIAPRSSFYNTDGFGVRPVRYTPK